ARYWYLEEARPETAWNVPAVLRICGPLDVERLRRCLNDVVRRHDGLRTRFEVVNGTPRQVIVPPFAAELSLIDGSPCAGGDPWSMALRIVADECAVPFDLAAGPPWAARLVRVGENDHACLVSLHHLIADLESLLTIPKELARLYHQLEM